MDLLHKIHELAEKGFLCEVVTDGWANWQFGQDGKPIINSDKPASVTPVPERYRLCFRGLYWYFDNINQLVHDDIGAFSISSGGAKRAYEELFKTYEDLKDEINPNGFNTK